MKPKIQTLQSITHRLHLHLHPNLNLNLFVTRLPHGNLLPLLSLLTLHGALHRLWWRDGVCVRTSVCERLCVTSFTVRSTASSTNATTDIANSITITLSLSLSVVS